MIFCEVGVHRILSIPEIFETFHVSSTVIRPGFNIEIIHIIAHFIRPLDGFSIVSVAFSIADVLCSLFCCHGNTLSDDSKVCVFLVKYVGSTQSSNLETGMRGF